MASYKTKFGAVIAFTFLLFIVHVTLSYLAGTEKAPSLFPKPVSNVSDDFKLYITPVGATFSIWGLIYFWQFAWLLYVLISVFRSGSGTEILSGNFYLAFILSTCFITGWLFAWTRENVVGSFILIIFNQIFIELSLLAASTDLKNYEGSHEITSENKADIWCHRILVQNGILFYATWTTVATLVNTAILLNKEIGASNQTASIIALVILAVGAISWFALESFAFQKYTDFTFSAYIGLIWALSGIFASSWKVNDPVGGLTLALLILSIIFLIVRVVLIVVRSTKRSSYESISYNSQSNTVRT